jgi:hypothetical protein
VFIIVVENGKENIVIQVIFTQYSGSSYEIGGYLYGLNSRILIRSTSSTNLKPVASLLVQYGVVESTGTGTLHLSHNVMDPKMPVKRKETTELNALG